jgi:hypothetical protein
VQVNRKWLAVLAALVVANAALAGLLYIRLTARAPDPLASRPGFTAGMVHAPLFPADDPNSWETAPVVKSFLPPGYSMQAAWSASRAYAGWGGDMRCWLKNTGANELFIYGIGLEGDWGPSVCATVGITIAPGQERYLGMIHFPGPPGPGMYDFTFKTGIKANATETGFLPPRGWWDYGYVTNAMKPLDFRPVAQAPHFKERINPAYFFDKANKLMNSKDPAVLQKADDILARFPGAFSIFQAAAAFDFVHANITYKAEPSGQDHWQSPAETLNLLTGDCEDYTLLLAAMITALGGTTRFHVETDHAFLSVYVGTDLQAATDALSRYYNTGVHPAPFSDRFGYWLSADATDSMFLGALPLGGEPLESGWGLTNTTIHYPVDMLAD